ncbi:MAG: glycosyltransferase family 4 protein [Bacteroidales bacterium]|nr:glycosyltransferase family 4 protein [Bacteroidales bacterium]
MKIRALIISSITQSAPSRPDAELILGLHSQGIDVDVMIPVDSRMIGRFADSGIRVIPDHPKRKFSLRSILRIRKEIRERKYQIIHLFNTKAIVNGSLAATGMNVKVIAYRGAAGMYWYDPTAWLSHLNPRIDRLICNSRYVQQHMQRQLLFRPGKAVMIHKGMDPEWFTEVSPIARQELGVPEDALVIGCVANVRPIKGVPYLIKASYHIDPALPVHILLIGSGMDSSDNFSLIRSSPLRDRIHILGYRPDVYEIIAACDIYIQPSLSESLSRSVMEAMCLGVPCIVSDIGGLLELVEHEKSGLVTERGNPIAIAQAIERMAGDRKLRKSYAGEAIIRMKTTFSVENMVASTRILYEEMVK